MSDKVAVVLSGCGVFDGSEVHESSAICVALTRLGKTPVFYAPNKTLYHEVDHVSGDSVDSTRNVMVEAGRISRGSVEPLSDLTSASCDAVIFPGGFGAAKNLSNFATSSDPSVDDDVARVINDFHDAKKVIGMCCIAPILAALVLGKGKGVPVKLTLGGRGDKWPYAGTIDKAVEFGADTVEMTVDEVCVDEENKLVTSPAYMYDGKFHEIHDGVAKMVGEIVQRM